MKKKIYIFLLGLSACFINACSEDTIDDASVGVIKGKVVLEGSNTPVPNAKISTNPATSEVFSNEDGNFIIPDVPVGDYSVQAQKDSLVAAFEGASVKANATVNVIFEMKPETALNEKPIAPELLTPEDNATDLNVNVDFVWTSSETDDDPINYSLEIRNNQNTEILTFNEITDTTYTVQGLRYNRRYFWQVSASDGVSPPVRSELFTFTTEPIADSRILFTRVIDGNNVIFALDEEGNEFQLTSSSDNSFRPRKNNAVDKIAFLRTVAGETHLFTMNLDGTEEFQVTSSVAVKGFNLEAVDFSWANNGAALVYPNFSNLYKINTNGSGTNLIYTTPDGNFITECDVNSSDTKIALITNNAEGYDASIVIIDWQGNMLETVVDGFGGAVGGIDFSVNSEKIIYTKDVSEYQSPSYRQLDTKLFLYDFGSQSEVNISTGKTPGTNDLDPRFSPNEAEIIFVNTSNDGISERDIYKVTISEPDNSRILLKENAKMPDWE
jgi:Tol biopolymer transport system component